MDIFYYFFIFAIILCIYKGYRFYKFYKPLVLKTCKEENISVKQFFKKYVF